MKKVIKTTGVFIVLICMLFFVIRAIEIKYIKLVEQSVEKCINEKIELLKKNKRFAKYLQ
ncbi:MAG: hypothetical protein ACFFG0_19175 [Candidatus Thorarchaeota archaeon]